MLIYTCTHHVQRMNPEEADSGVDGVRYLELPQGHTVARRGEHCYSQTVYMCMSVSQSVSIFMCISVSQVGRQSGRQVFDWSEVSERVRDGYK